MPGVGGVLGGGATAAGGSWGGRCRRAAWCLGRRSCRHPGLLQLLDAGGHLGHLLLELGQHLGQGVVVLPGDLAQDLVQLTADLLLQVLGYAGEGRLQARDVHIFGDDAHSHSA